MGRSPPGTGGPLRLRSPDRLSAAVPVPFPSAQPRGHLQSVGLPASSSPPGGCLKCLRLGTYMSSRPCWRKGDARRAGAEETAGLTCLQGEWFGLLICPKRATGAGRRRGLSQRGGKPSLSISPDSLPALRLLHTGPSPAAPGYTLICSHALLGGHNFLCFLMFLFHCFKASATVKPGPEPLASRRRLVQEQAGRPAEARHQRHALLALPAHRGKGDGGLEPAGPSAACSLAPFLEKSYVSGPVGLL